MGSSFDANGGLVNISGAAQVGDGFDVFFDSVVNISDAAQVGSDFRALNGSEVNVSGGSVGDGFSALFGSVVNISGGSVGDAFMASFSSTVNLSGSGFLLDGVSLEPQLTLNEAFTLTDRGGAVLSGTLADGTAFDFVLNELFIGGQDQFDAEATLTLTLVPEPGVLSLLALGGVGLLTRRRMGGA